MNIQHAWFWRGPQQVHALISQLPGAGPCKKEMNAFFFNSITTQPGYKDAIFEQYNSGGRFLLVI